VELYGRRKTNLINAHEGGLAAIALTVDGSLLATASERGTIIRLFDTGKKSSSSGGDELSSSPTRTTTTSMSSSSSSSGTPLREFRRGVEQAKIGCLCFSLDKFWLGCTSDRGTVHVFKVNKKDEETKSGGGGKELKNKMQQKKKREQESSSNTIISTSTYAASKLARSLIPNVITKSTKKYLLEGPEHSYAQVRGIPHPKTCAFVPHNPNTIAVAGMDGYGNGCLLLVRFGPETEDEEQQQHDHLRQRRHEASPLLGNSSRSKQKATEGQVHRIAYHRFFKKGTTAEIPKVNLESGCGGERETVKGDLVLNENAIDGSGFLGDAMDQIIFNDDDDAEGFVNVDTDNQGKAVKDAPNDNTLEEKKIDNESSSCQVDQGNNEEADTKS